MRTQMNKFEVVHPEKHKVSAAILSDYTKSPDWRLRKAKGIEYISLDMIGAIIPMQVEF
jgi:hypothetical protein